MGDELRPDQAAMLDALKADTSHEAFKRVERLSDRVWKLVEDDEFDEQPHLYLIRGEDKLVLFDTGTGRADLHAFVRSGAMCDVAAREPTAHRVPAVVQKEEAWCKRGRVERTGHG